jgi:DNA-binding CsgD family transcriptional regulator
MSASCWPGVTPSERAVARLVVAGLTNNEIAQRPGMSPHRRCPLRRVFARLGVNARVELTAEYA